MVGTAEDVEDHAAETGVVDEVQAQEIVVVEDEFGVAQGLAQARVETGPYDARARRDESRHVHEQLCSVSGQCK